LDDVGFAGALPQHVIRYDGAVRVEVGCTLDAADAPGRLPAAVEVVAEARLPLRPA